MSNRLSSQLEESLSACRCAAIEKRYVDLRTAAQSALSFDAACSEAWLFLISALFAQRRYAELSSCVSNFIRLPTISSETKYSGKVVQDAISILRRIEGRKNSETPTSQLQNGWYRSHLQHLLDNDSIPSLPRSHGIVPALATNIIDHLSTRDEFAYSDKPRLKFSGEATFDDVVITKMLYKPKYNKIEIEQPGGERRYVVLSKMSGFPCDQAIGGLMYLKDELKELTCGCYKEVGFGPCQECVYSLIPVPIYRFPQLDVELPEHHHVLGDFAVMACCRIVPDALHNMLRKELDRLGFARPESTGPMYHNIIDPNIGSDGGLWVPVDVTVSELSGKDMLKTIQESAKKTIKTELPTDVFNIVSEYYNPPSSLIDAKLCSEIPDILPTMYPKLYAALEKLLNISLPFVAKLKRPALLFPGPLQAVVKAQRIVLTDGERYEGEWHDDGINEHVIATVAYTYRKSGCLKGGGIEFASKESLQMGYYDYNGDYNLTTDENATRKAAKKFSKCIADTSEGSLLVFNNYACVHRVLPMFAGGDSGSMDFVSFFIIDQQHPLPIPQNLAPRVERLSKRSEMQKKELSKAGHFGLSEDDPFLAGSGPHVDLKWIHSSQVCSTSFLEHLSEYDAAPHITVASMLNMPPPVLGRGWSFLNDFETPQLHFDAKSRIDLHQIGKEGNMVNVFVDKDELTFYSEIPTENDEGSSTYLSEYVYKKKGVRAIQQFEDVQQWLDLGLNTFESDLKENVLALNRSSP